jgi:hypothetical protein
MHNIHCNTRVRDVELNVSLLSQLKYTWCPRTSPLCFRSASLLKYRYSKIAGFSRYHSQTNRSRQLPISPKAEHHYRTTGWPVNSYYRASGRCATGWGQCQHAPSGRVGIDRIKCTMYVVVPVRIDTLRKRFLYTGSNSYGRIQ